MRYQVVFFRTFFLRTATMKPPSRAAANPGDTQPMLPRQATPATKGLK
jgi:hypothetical protein